MRKELVAALAAAFVLAVGTASFLPVGAFAAEKAKKEVSACAEITDKAKKTECRKAEAKAKKEHMKKNADTKKKAKK